VVPNSSDLNLLDYQAWGNAGVLLQAAIKAKNALTDALLLISSALPEKAIDNTVKDNRN